MPSKTVKGLGLRSSWAPITRPQRDDFRAQLRPVKPPGCHIRSTMKLSSLPQVLGRATRSYRVHLGQAPVMRTT